MINATYQAGQRGWWLMTHWQPSLASGQHLLILPPFAEEANRSRRLFNKLCQQLSAQGWHCYLPDFYGTGDSDGDFAESDLDLWQQDLCQWLLTEKLTQPIHLLACRFGALQLLGMWPALQQVIEAGKVLLWQPQFDCQKFLQQLFRQHQASQLLQSSKGLSAAEHLANGQTVAIAGYDISPKLYTQIKALNPDLALWRQQPICWLELSTLQQLPVPAVKAWQQIAADAATSQQVLLALPAFWLQQEPLPVDALITQSLQFLTGDQHD